MWTAENEKRMRADIAASEQIAREQGIPPRRVTLTYEDAAAALAEIDRLTGERVELLANLGTGKVWVCPTCTAVSPAAPGYEIGISEPCALCGEGIARVVMGTGRAPTNASLEARADGARLVFETVLGSAAPKSFTRASWEAVVDYCDASRPGLTEEQARRMARNAIRTLTTTADVERVTSAILRASRGETGAAAVDPPTPDRPSGLTRAMHDAAQRPSEPAPPSAPPEPADPLAPYRSTRVPRAECKCPEDMRVPLSGDGWLCGDCGADAAAPPSVRDPISLDERLPAAREPIAP